MGSIEPDPGKPVLLREGDLSRSYGRARAGNADDPLARSSSKLVAWLVEQACCPPMSNQCIFEPLRANGEEMLSAALPDQATRRGERFVIDDVDCNDLGTHGEFLLQPLRGVAALYGKVVDEAYAFAGLLPEVTADICLIHGRNRMAGHGRMAVKPIANSGSDCEQVSEGLVTPDWGGCDDERAPRATEYGSRKIDCLADRSNVRRRVEGRADLVMRNGSFQPC